MSHLQEKPFGDEIMAYKEVYGRSYRSPFLSAESRQGQTWEGKFTEVTKYLSQNSKEIDCVKFVAKSGEEYMIATFTVRVSENAPKGEATMNRPVKLSSVKTDKDKWVWDCDFP